MSPRSRLLLLQKLQKRKKKPNGFTLIELMIVVAVVGILGALALPRYLAARDAAKAGAQIGEKLGLAKECATFVISGVGSTPPAPCSTTGGTFTANWDNPVDNINCLDKKGGGTSADIVVGSDGALSCTIN